MLKKADTVLVPTLACAESLAEKGTKFGFGPHMEENAKVAVERGRVVLQMAREAGIRIAVGTDPVHQETIAMECACMKMAGLTPMEVITSATKTGAELLGVQEHLGTLETDKTADLIALKNNPLEDITALKNVNWVIKGGQIRKSPGEGNF
jgi:imidazolonepropionase-like amidohydrolase